MESNNNEQRKDLSEYLESLKNLRDWYSVMKTQLNKGRVEGREEGRKEGQIAERLKIARGMKEKGIPTELIVSITGLSPEEIETL